ncbi:MAG: hypothetical protein IT377_14950 [Polyangiaceae bacterium]|nr:hypothetical protein [Polyangiaceae bacterium]
MAVLLALPGCSGSDEQAGGGVGKVPAAFSAYCTGTTKVAIDLQEAQGPAVWVGSNATGSAPAGSEFLVAASFDKWEGFVFESDGTPLRLDGDFQSGLVKDQDFTSDCAVDATTPKTDTVLLANSHFYSTESLSGSACTLPAGTVLTNYSFMSAGSVATVGSAEIAAQCSHQKAYSSDIVYGDLISK